MILVSLFKTKRSQQSINILHRGKIWNLILDKPRNLHFKTLKNKKTAFNVITRRVTVYQYLHCIA